VKTLFDLTHEQQEADRFLERNLSGVLWGDVGTGKTAVACTAILGLLESFSVHRTLVVGTRLIADRVWNTEVKEWEHLTGLRVRRIVGTPSQRLDALNADDADIWVVSRDNLCWLEEQFIRIEGTDGNGKPIRKQFRKFKWDTVILDESQSFKSQTSNRFKSIRRLRRLFTRCYLLTGSLMPNGYRDLWSQYFLVDGGERLGASENQYLEKFFTKNVLDGVVSHELRKGADKEIDALIADVTFVMRDTRPKVPRNIITVSLSEKEQKLYSKMARESVIDVGGSTITAVNAGVLWGKLLQMSTARSTTKRRHTMLSTMQRLRLCWSFWKLSRGLSSLDMVLFMTWKELGTGSQSEGLQTWRSLGPTRLWTLGALAGLKWASCIRPLPVMVSMTYTSQDAATSFGSVTLPIESSTTS
jgi:SNF2 family DNA or RNA helicase